MSRKVSIYIDKPELFQRLKITAVQQNKTISAFCQEAIEEKLAKVENDFNQLAFQAARRLDARRQRLGTLDLSTSELVKEGRYR